MNIDERLEKLFRDFEALRESIKRIEKKALSRKRPPEDTQGPQQ